MSGGPPLWSCDRGCPNAFRAVRPFPVRVASGLPWRAGWSGRCPAGHDGAGGVRNLSDHGDQRGRWDTTARTSDGGPGLGTFRHRARVQVVMTGGPDAGSGWGGRRQACPLPSCPVRARTSGPRSWPWPAGRTHVRRCPPLGRRRPDRVHPSAGRPSRTGDVRRTGRSRGRPCPSPGQPVLVSAGGTDRRRRCPGGCPATAPWRKRAAGRTAGMSGTPWRGLEVPTGRSRVGCGGPTRGSGAEACLRAIDRPHGRVWGGWGQWVSAGNSPALALAGPTGGSARRRVVPRRG